MKTVGADLASRRVACAPARGVLLSLTAVATLTQVPCAHASEDPTRLRLSLSLNSVPKGELSSEVTVEGAAIRLRLAASLESAAVGELAPAFVELGRGDGGRPLSGAVSPGFAPQGDLLAARDGSDGDGDEAGTRAGAAGSDGPTGPARPARAAPKAVSETRWRKAPIRWTGNLQTSLTMLLPSDGRRSTVLSDTANLGFNSYIYAPWFIKLNGAGYYNTFRSNSAEQKFSTHSFGASVVSSIFPISRFPASVSLAQDYSFSTTNVSDGVDKSRFVATRLGLTQAYAPADGKYNVSGAFEHNDSRVSNGTRNSGNRLTGNYYQSIRGDNPQDLSATANYIASTARAPVVNGVGGNAGSNSLTGAARHTIYLEDYVMTLTNNADAGVNRFRSFDGLEFNSTTLQARSNMDWVPSDDWPIRIIGYTNASYSDLQAGNEKTQFTSGTMNYGTTYKINDYLSANGGVLADYLAAPGETKTKIGLYGGLTASLGAGRGLSGQDAIDFGGWAYRYSYSAQAGIGGGLGVDIASGAVPSLSPQVGSTLSHSLSRSFPVSAGDPVNVTFEQSLGGNYTFGSSGSYGGSSRLGGSLQSSGRIEWRYNRDYQAVFSTKFEAKNVESFGESRSTASNISGSADGSLVLSPSSSVSSTLAISASRQGLVQVPGGSAPGFRAGNDWTWSVGGSLSYTDGYFLKIPRLGYTATYRANLYPGSSLGLGDTSAGGITAFHSIEQRATYSIGLLSTELTHTLNYSQGRMDNVIFLMLRRSLSGVL